MDKTKQKFNTMVLDPKEGFALEYVYVKESSKERETLGRMWRYGKNLVHLVVKNNGTMTPVEPPPKMGETPEKLYRALMWEREAEILFMLRNTLLEKLKLIGMYALIGILLLFIFLIFSSL